MAETIPNKPGTKPKPYFHFRVETFPFGSADGRTKTWQFTLKPGTHKILEQPLQADNDAFKEIPTRHLFMIPVYKNVGGNLTVRGDLDLFIDVYSTRHEFTIARIQRFYIDWKEGEPDWSDFIKSKPQELCSWLEELVGMPVFAPPPLVVDDPADDCEWSVF